MVERDDGATPPPPPPKRGGRKSPEAPSSSDTEVGSVAQALRGATARLGADWARDEAEMLMAHALGVTRSAMLLARMGDPVPASFATMLSRRLADEPLAYITGETEFYGRRFAVTQAVLIPRGDSETVVAAALEAAPDARRILDCGTGSGCLLLSLLAERPGASGIGIDRSGAALAVAASNAVSLGVAERAALMEADWSRPGWAGDLGRFDLVLANPPYVEDAAELDSSVRDFEPAGALFAGPEGLEAYRVLVPQLPALLTSDGVAVLEIGHTQAEAVTAIAEAAGFAVALRRDLADRPRALILSQKSLAKPSRGITSTSDRRKGTGPSDTVRLRQLQISLSASLRLAGPARGAALAAASGAGVTRLTTGRQTRPVPLERGTDFL